MNVLVGRAWLGEDWREERGLRRLSGCLEAGFCPESDPTCPFTNAGARAPCQSGFLLELLAVPVSVGPGYVLLGMQGNLKLYFTSVYK